jgi:hypothetical protein
MLDGMAFLMQVYPKLLPYSLGGEHLEILLRPIPRSLWPGKPVGGYMNKLGLFTASSGVTVGISPTLFGDFYQEGGWPGIVICSVIYAWFAAWVIKYSASIRMIFGTLIRACLIAGCLPLLRGGDLPGIYAWIGMSLWPVLIFLWWNREFLKAQGGTYESGAHRSESPKSTAVKCQPDGRNWPRLPRGIPERVPYQFIFRASRIARASFTGKAVARRFSAPRRLLSDRSKPIQF